jgi:outer membrane lipoprotein-sorting protein
MPSFDRLTEPLRRFAAYFGILATATFLACGPPRYSPVVPLRNEPAVVFEVVRQREDHIQSLRARFKATAYQGSDENDVQGVLLVRKADRFRMRLMLPLGITVLDYVSHGSRTWTLLPLSKEDNTAEATLFSPADVRETFLRGPAAFPGTCSATSDSVSIVDVACRACDHCPLLRSLRLDRRGATIVDEKSYDDGGPRLAIHYDDYREVAGLPLPFHILMTYPARRLNVEIKIREYEVNPELKDKLFEPPQGAKPETGAVIPHPGAQSPV